MAGNVLGNRASHLYVDDVGAEFSFYTDVDLGSAAGAILDDGKPSFPRLFRPRGVFVQAVIGGKVKRKFLICPTSTAALYHANTTQVVTVDGTPFQVTGRKGETRSFRTNAIATP